MLSAGIAVIFWVHQIKFKYFSRMSQVLIWVAAGLLLITLLFGLNINGASRWIKIPIINQNFQTLFYLDRTYNVCSQNAHCKEGQAP